MTDEIDFEKVFEAQQKRYRPGGRAAPTGPSSEEQRQRQHMASRIRQLESDLKSSRRHVAHLRIEVRNMKRLNTRLENRLSRAQMELRAARAEQSSSSKRLSSIDAKRLRSFLHPDKHQQCGHADKADGLSQIMQDMINSWVGKRR